MKVEHDLARHQALLEKTNFDTLTAGSRTFKSIKSCIHDLSVSSKLTKRKPCKWTINLTTLAFSSL